MSHLHGHPQTHGAQGMLQPHVTKPQHSKHETHSEEESELLDTLSRYTAAVKKEDDYANGAATRWMLLGYIEKASANKTSHQIVDAVEKAEKAIQESRDAPYRRLQMRLR